MGDDKIERRAGGLSADFGGMAVAMHALGKAPGPDGERIGGTETAGDIAQSGRHALLFGGADVGEGAAGLEDLAEGLGGAALDARCGHHVSLL